MVVLACVDSDAKGKSAVQTVLLRGTTINNKWGKGLSEGYI
jgi:hypothetical protein